MYSHKCNICITDTCAAAVIESCIITIRHAQATSTTHICSKIIMHDCAVVVIHAFGVSTLQACTMAFTPHMKASSASFARHLEVISELFHMSLCVRDVRKRVVMHSQCTMVDYYYECVQAMTRNDWHAQPSNQPSIVCCTMNH